VAELRVRAQLLLVQHWQPVGLPGERGWVEAAITEATELVWVVLLNGEVLAEDDAETISAEAKAEQAAVVCTAAGAGELDAELPEPQVTSPGPQEALADVMLTQAV